VVSNSEKLSSKQEMLLKTKIMNLENQVSTLKNELGQQVRELIEKDTEIESCKNNMMGMEVLKRTNERLYSELNELNN
jgi:septal ring factor EnvC (AmiA/AmiB activator)